MQRNIQTKFAMNFNSEESLVLEIASNDGYLLKNFKEKNIPCLGVEPTLSTAECSQKLGIKTITEFFTFRLASSLTQKN